MKRGWIIDADTHITEPADVWTARLPKRLHEHIPVVERSDAGRDVWLLEGEQISSVGASAFAGWPLAFPDSPPTYADCHPAAYDAHARLAYMDEVGIWAQVIYPNVAGFGSQRFLQIRDDELKLICVRAYNDFLRDWASADARRIITICSTPFWDLEAAVAEVARCAEAGHRGVLFTGEPQRFGLPVLGDRHWDPLYATAQEAGLPIHFHIGSGDAASWTPERAEASGTANAYAFASTELFLKNAQQCADITTSGVLQRFPDLRFVSVESGIGWIPFMLEAVDYSYLEAREGRKSEWGTMLPSDFFRRQVYATYWFEQIAPTKLLEQLPVDNIMFETDFPHPTCLYGDVRETAARSLAAASPAVRAKFLWENAARLYDIADPDVEWVEPSLTPSEMAS